MLFYYFYNKKYYKKMLPELQAQYNEHPTKELKKELDKFKEGGEYYKKVKVDMFSTDVACWCMLVPTAFAGFLGALFGIVLYQIIGGLAKWAERIDT